MPNSLTYFNWTPTFKWCVVWCHSKNINHTYVRTKNRLSYGNPLKQNEIDFECLRCQKTFLDSSTCVCET